jgi:tetratricopeptide (TPR) repeat protein
MLKEISQEDFYWQFAGEFQDAVGGRKLYCGTKTPCVLSSRERSTQAREQYYQEFIRAVKSGRLHAQYCFAWPPTVELLGATLFSPDDQECQQQREQLQEVKSLADQHLLDLRWCPTLALPSGIVGSKIAAIHNKDATGLHTVSVQLATDEDAQSYSVGFVHFTEQLMRLDDIGFLRLIEESKIKCFTQRVVSYVDETLRRLGEELLELDRIEAATLEALKLGAAPTEGDLRILLNRLFPDRQKISKDLWARIIAAGLERYVGVIDSAETILTKSSVKLVPLQGQRQVKVNFGPAGVKVNDSDSEDPYNSAWRMTEYFVWRNNPVHWREGYLFYPTWLKKGGVRDGRKQFREKINTYAHYLKDNYGIRLEFKGDKSENAEYWRLINHNVTTNIPEAEKHYKEADRLVQNGDFPGAKEELKEALRIYPNYLQSHLLLTRCYEEQGFENVTADELKDVLWPSWEYLKEKCAVLERMDDIASKKNNEGLRAFIKKLEYDPIYCGLKEHTKILGKWLIDRDDTEDAKLLLELEALLKITASTTDDSIKKEKIAAFCQIPCVKEVLLSMGKIWPVLIGTLFYADVENGLQDYKLEAFARKSFRSVKDFQRYLRNALTSLKKALKAKGVLPETTIFEKTVRLIEKVNQIEEKLRQERSKEITDDELAEEIETKLGWELEDIKEILFYRKKRLAYYGDMSFFGVEDEEINIEDANNEL